MNAKQVGWGLALLWLTGCATPGPTQQEQIQLQVQTQAQEQARAQTLEQTRAQAREQALEQALIQAQKQEQEQKLSASRLLAGLQHVAALKPKIAKQMIDHSKTGAAEQTAGDRFELVLLLSQKAVDDKALKRALQLLDGLEADAVETSVREILRLLRRNLLLEQQYRSEQRKTAELQEKIEYLKGLERELEETNRRMEAPSSPTPELPR